MESWLEWTGKDHGWWTRRCLGLVWFVVPSPSEAPLPRLPTHEGKAEAAYFSPAALSAGVSMQPEQVYSLLRLGVLVVFLGLGFYWGVCLDGTLVRHGLGARLGSGWTPLLLLIEFPFSSLETRHDDDGRVDGFPSLSRLFVCLMHSRRANDSLFVVAPVPKLGGSLWGV